MPADTHANLHLSLIDCAKSGDCEGVASLLALGASPMSRDSAALFEAASHGHASCVELLIPVSDPMAVACRALRHASLCGHASIVKLLLPVSDPLARNSQALVLAAEHGHKECVQLLAQCSDPSANSFSPFRMAAGNGHVECVKLLASVLGSDSSEAIANAIHAAAARGHAECVQALIELAGASPQGAGFSLAIAAHGGHIECAALLMPLALPLEIAHAFCMAMDSGHALVVADMISRDPTLAGLITHDHRKEALDSHHDELSELLLSLFERQAIGDLLPADSASSSPRSARI